MKKQNLFLIVGILLSFGITTSSFHSPVWASSEDEELKSTIPSDPEHHSSSTKTKSSTSTESESKPKSHHEKKASKKVEKAAQAASGEEWQTMHSEQNYRRPKNVEGTQPNTPPAHVSHTSSSPSAPAPFAMDEKNEKLLVGKIIFNEQQNDQQTEPTAPSLAKLKKLGTYLAKQNTGLELKIEVHTDTVGSDQQNLDLTQKRADALKKILTDEGVADSRIEAVGQGDKTPLVDDHTLEGQLKNRRVDFVVTRQGSSNTPPPVETKNEPTETPKTPLKTPEDPITPPTSQPSTSVTIPAPTTVPSTPPTTPAPPPPAPPPAPAPTPATPPVPSSVLSTTPPTSLTPTLPATPPVVTPPVATPPVATPPVSAPTTAPTH